jgi:hypothetical protein
MTTSTIKTETNAMALSVTSLEAEIKEVGGRVLVARKRLDLLEQRTSEPFSRGGFSRVHPNQAQEARDLAQTIQADEILLRELQNILKLRYAAETKRREAKERLEKWEAAQQRCRALRAEHDRARTAAAELHDTRDFLQKELLDAISQTDEAIANPPTMDDFPTPADFAEHETLCNRYKRKQTEMGAKLRDVDTALQKQILTTLEIAGRLDTAMIVERNLRPPEAK